MDKNFVEFKKKLTLEGRKAESARILKKFPNRIPIITEKCGNNPNIPHIDKNKFLVPNDLTLGQYAYVIRKRVKLKPEHGLFYFINNKMFWIWITYYRTFANIIFKISYRKSFSCII